MTEQQDERQVFMDKRARALTMMLLTRREDLLIEEVEEDIGLDYIVRFHTEGKGGLREFGITLRGVWEAETKADADQAMLPAMQELQRHGPSLRPVCLFCFAMVKDTAWFTWMAEPSEAESGKPLLRWCDEPDCQPLDRKALKEIIQRVDAWYDAIFPSLIVNGGTTGKPSPKGSRRH